MPAAFSKWPSRRPEGPAPTIATFVFRMLRTDPSTAQSSRAPGRQIKSAIQLDEALPARLIPALREAGQIGLHPSKPVDFRRELPIDRPWLILRAAPPALPG